ncbi:MAG: hypothetical protein IIB07_07750 [Bacteroidetes bacterium]|nr:hypothetical protein [Bacteroidota bacterium]
MDSKTIGAGAGILIIFIILSLQGLPASDNLQELLLSIIKGMSEVLIPFLFALALLFFIFNVVRYFFIEVNNPDGKDKARKLAIYGIAAFVFILVLWGIVNLLVGGVGFGRSQPICPDSVPAWVCLGSDPNDQAPEE